MTDLEKAIAEVNHITGNGAGWDAWDFWAGGEHHDEPTAFNHAEATILNAVVSGELVPATERDAAVAAALEDAARHLRQCMAAYAASVHEADDAETDDLAADIAASWFSHWIKLDYPSDNEKDPEVAPRAKRMLADVDLALSGINPILALINQPQADAMEKEAHAHIKLWGDALRRAEAAEGELVVTDKLLLAEAQQSLDRLARAEAAEAEIAELKLDAAARDVRIFELREELDNAEAKLAELTNAVAAAWAHDGEPTNADIARILEAIPTRAALNKEPKT